MPADPITPPASGNLVPTTGLNQAAGGSNLAPATPGLNQAAAAGNLTPTTGLNQAASAGNRNPTNPTPIV